MSKKQPLIFIQRILPFSLLLIATSGACAMLHLSYAGWLPPKPSPLLPQDQALLRTTPSLWIDARDPLLYEMEHIPGALNLNQKNWDTQLPRFFEAYQQDQPVIIYCSVGCKESHAIANRLRQLGINQVHVFEAGFEAWKEEAKKIR